MIPRTRSADAADDNAYLDDRHAPGYLRFDPVASCTANAKVVDGLILDLRPADFARRVPGPETPNCDETPQAAHDATLAK